jgi:drug/metabolite transporter (DMT)-like permease
MTTATGTATEHRPATWALVLAFAIIYLSWGTTYLAIKEGVKTLPPALFAGPRLCLAGLIIIAFMLIRRHSLRMPWRELGRMAVGATIMFVGGNGLITAAERTVDSGVASVLVATTPLFIALLEFVWPWGERLTLRGWLGLLIGMSGVVILLVPKLEHPSQFLQDHGPIMVLGSALCWAMGSLILRYGRRHGSHLAAAAYQMIIGGLGLTVIGLSIGELHEITPASFTPGAVFAFFYLLIVGSLLGFVAYTWLLGHVSAAMAGTYAYVNPIVAIFVGWLLANEEINGWIIGGMVVILAGVALVRTGGIRPRKDHVHPQHRVTGAPEVNPTITMRAPVLDGKPLVRSSEA